MPHLASMAEKCILFCEKSIWGNSLSVTSEGMRHVRRRENPKRLGFCGNVPSSMFLRKKSKFGARNFSAHLAHERTKTVVNEWKEMQDNPLNPQKYSRSFSVLKCCKFVHIRLNFQTFRWRSFQKTWKLVYNSIETRQLKQVSDSGHSL